MNRFGKVIINNCDSNATGFEVARVVDNVLWHYGTYDSAEKAYEVAEDLGEYAIVASLEDED